jgi:hypothetical protein
MMHNPLHYLFAESFESMFVIDKRGKTVFFPWGSSKSGYFVQNKRVEEKIKRFYRSSFFTCFFALGVSISIFHNFWAILGSMVIFLGGWYLAYYLYTSRLIIGLLPAKSSYKDIVLEKLEPEEVEEAVLPDMQFPQQLNKQVVPRTNDPFIGIKSFWYQLSPAHLFMIYLFTGIAISLVWVRYQPKGLGANQLDYLVWALVCFLWGLSFFVLWKNMETSKAEILRFLSWKLPMILLTIALWTLTVLSLYKFVVMIVS